MSHKLEEQEQEDKVIQFPPTANEIDPEEPVTEPEEETASEEESLPPVIEVTQTMKFRTAKIVTIPVTPPADLQEEEDEDEEEDDEEEEEDDFLQRPFRFKKKEPPPDLPPSQLARSFGRGLGVLRLRQVLVGLITIILILLALSPLVGYPLPQPWDGNFSLQCFGSVVLLATCMLLGADLLWKGFADLCRLRPGGETLITLSCGFALADGLTMAQLTPERLELPYCAAAALSLFCGMKGTYAKREGLRLSCRTVATSAHPHLVTLDGRETKEQRAAYHSWLGVPLGFGSQVQEPDGAQKVYRIVAPLLIIGCISLSVVASYGREVPNQLIWCLSATTASVASLAMLCIFGPSFLRLSRRLFSQGAAMAGWSGVAQKGDAILIGDQDLFPEGTVVVSGIRVFGNVPLEKMIAVTTTLLRAAGTAIHQPFYELLRAHGGTYRPISGEFVRHEVGGFTAFVRDQRIDVGTSALMAELAVSLPSGLDLKNALFCAIDGELAGMFSLTYRLHPAIAPSFHSLLTNRVEGILVTRDCSLNPAVLHQRFKLPITRLTCPSVEERVARSDLDAPHNPRLTAVLCRDGLAPFADAVIGAKRLRLAVYLSTFFSVVGSVLGLVLAYYLTAQSAYEALTVANLLIFLLAWLVPNVIFTLWVNRY